jgi:hypothetical protein
VESVEWEGVGRSKKAAAALQPPRTTLTAAAAPPALPPNLRRWQQRRGKALPLRAAQYLPASGRAAGLKKC